MGNSVIRNYDVKVNTRKKQSTLTVYTHPVEILTPRGWVSIKEEMENAISNTSNNSQELSSEEREYLELLGAFGEAKLASTIILDSVDISGIEIVGRDRVKHVIDAETKAELPFKREFSYVYGASEVSGVIVLPYDDYSDVYVISDADEDGVAELSYVKTKEEMEGVRPYYEKKDGQTYIYVNHFSGGGGTQADPYIISNDIDLDGVRNKLSAWYALDRDIVMNSFQTGEGFTPIGLNVNTPFLGVLDGNGFSIKNLFMNQDRDFVGLFGYARNATIRNLRVAECNIINKKANTGTLIGFAHNTIIHNCNVIGGSVEGLGGTVGGLIGHAYAYNNYSGSTEVKYCYNHKCTVKSPLDHVGGLCGYYSYSNSYAPNTIMYCYSTGQVLDTSVAQNRTGISGFIGTATGTTLITECYWDMETSGRTQGAAGTGMSTYDMKKQATYANWNFQVYWDISDDFNSGYPEHRQFIRYKGGKGTQADPFIIHSEYDVGQMRWFRSAAHYYRFEDDVKFISNQTGIGFYPLGFDLIGKEPSFRGKVDGAGRSVANIFINTQVPNNSLFGIVSQAEIYNLDIIDCNITGSGYTGAMVGNSTNSTFYNCHVDTFNSCRVVGNGNYSGGFVGLSSTGSIIKDCSTNLLMQGSSYIGGFVGYNSGTSKISRCYSTGRIEATGAYSGGFVGNSDTAGSIIEDCYTDTDVNGTYVGGFGGYTNQGAITRRCVAFGKAYGTNSATGFFYTHAGNPAYSDNFYDRETYKIATSPGAIGKFTSEMKHPAIYVNFDMADVWVLNNKHNNGYPALRKLLPLDLPILGFRNEYGKFYTDNAGGILRYLDFGTLIASQTSMNKSVWLQNNADFPVNSMKVWVEGVTVQAGVDVKLSITESPFIPTDEIIFSGTFSKGASAKFLIRVGSDISVKTGGTFELKAKASPA